MLGAAILLLGGCSGGEDSDPEPLRADPTVAERPPPHKPAPKPSHCPADLGNCATASGRIVYVERVDPDGDGDAHFVVASRDSITLPGPGDRISAAGPVYRGSYGQRQIEAIELHVAR